MLSRNLQASQEKKKNQAGHRCPEYAPSLLCSDIREMTSPEGVIWMIKVSFSAPDYFQSSVETLHYISGEKKLSKYKYTIFPP